jgi:Uma2 family endonuclease
MGDPAQRRATYQDLLSVPENLIAEIIHGVLHTQARPASPHARAASVLGVELGGPFDRGRGGPGGWLVLDEPELHLHGDVLVSDLAAWRRTRMPVMPEASAFELSPDWICEVLSPGRGAIDRGEKMPIYAREGVAFAWLVDPIEKVLEAYGLKDGKWVQLGVWTGDALVRAEPFEVFELELGGLWAR